MTTQEFIEKAIEGGYKGRGIATNGSWFGDSVFLIPEVWQAAGKAGGFKDERYCASGAGCEWDNQSNHEFACVWKYSAPKPENLAVGMMVALFEGKSVEEYLGTL